MKWHHSTISPVYAIVLCFASWDQYGVHVMVD